MERPDKLNPRAALDDVHAELAPVYYLLPLLLPGMYERRWGRIIGLSMARPFNCPAYAYNVAKAARTHALLLLRDEAWAHSVTVNVVAPGPVAQIEQFNRAVELCDQGAEWRDRSDVTPQDIAEGVAMLCSNVGGYISGCELPAMFQRRRQ